MGTGRTTDGALFFHTMAKPLPPGILKVICGNQLFEFVLTESTPQLKTR
jgi:hypothetical protein